VKVRVNGEDSIVEDGATVELLIAQRVGSTRGSAVVVDGEVVPRSRWAAQQLTDGADVELITAVQGG